MMGAFGRFLELSVPTGDILKSLAFWRALGFAELPTGDIRRHHYAVVTDGAIAIGLHAGGIEEPALSFVRPNLAKQVRALEEAGREFEFVRLGAEEFHEAALRSPDGHLILMMEARTFSPGAANDGLAPQLGRCIEICLACRDPEASRAFWEAAGFIAGEPGDSGELRLIAPGAALGLRAAGRTGTLALRFEPGDADVALATLAAKGFTPTRTAEGLVLKSPEGLLLILG
jgi:catechol 2,3-dioxygenase-like lactoylglutathione lyase family enzyme